MSVTMNLHGVTAVKSHEAQSGGSRWVTLSFNDEDARSVLELTVFSDTPSVLLAPLADQALDGAKSVAYAEGRADEREEWADLLAAAQCAESVLFLLSKELEAMGHNAPNVPRMLSTAIARVTSNEAEAEGMRRNERLMESQYP